MKIELFRFVDGRTGWTLEETHFDAFNLLVGVSGAGKTRIVEALRRVCDVTRGESLQATWSLTFDHAGTRYRWDAETDVAAPVPSLGSASEISISPTIIFITEKLYINNSLLVERDGQEFRFAGKILPRLDRSLSTILLLSDEDKIKSVADGFSKIYFSQASLPRKNYISKEFNKELNFIQRSNDTFRRYVDLAGHGKISASQLLDLYLAQPEYLLESIPIVVKILEGFLFEKWNAIKSTYRAIFPFVLDIKTIDEREQDRTIFDLWIHESTIGWFPYANLSSGMHRVLIHLIELAITPPGSVIIIDEFENSLGVNCMPALVDFLLEKAPDHQFILTSHHPYIINQLPVETWKVVTRHGHTVRLTPARDIPAMQGVSHHQAFTRLLNLREYQQDLS